MKGVKKNSRKSQLLTVIDLFTHKKPFLLKKEDLINGLILFLHPKSAKRN